MDKTVRLWDPFLIKELACFSHHTEAVKDIAWNWDSSNLISGGFDKTVQQIDVSTGTCIHKFRHEEFITAVKFHPQEKDLFVAGADKHGVVSWDTRTKRMVTHYRGKFGTVQDMEFINGTDLATCSDVTQRNSLDKAILVFDFKTGAEMSNQIYQEGYSCTCIKKHPYKPIFFAQSNGGYIALFSSKRPYLLDKNKRFEGAHQVSGFHIGIDVSLDGNMVASGSANGHISFYQSESTAVIKSLKAHKQAAIDVKYHPLLSSTVASCSWDGEIKIWE